MERNRALSSLTESTSDLWRELGVSRPPQYDNSALRARLAGAKVEDRPILSELHRAMAERDAFATQPPKR
jgi:hypothetical protein